MKCGSCRTSMAEKYTKVDSGRLYEILKNLNSRRAYNPNRRYFCDKCISKANFELTLNNVSDQNANSLTLTTSKSSDSAKLSTKDENTFTYKEMPLLPVKRSWPFTGHKPCPKRYKPAKKPRSMKQNSGHQNEAPRQVSTEETSSAQGHDKSKEPDNLPAATVPISDSSSEVLQTLLTTPPSGHSSLNANSNHSDSSSNEGEEFVKLGDPDAAILPIEPLSPDRVAESGTHQYVGGTESDQSDQSDKPQSGRIAKPRPRVVKPKTRWQPPRRPSESSSASDRSTSSNGSESKKSRPTSGGVGKRNLGSSTTSGSNGTVQRPSTTSGRMEPQSSTRRIDEDSDADSLNGTVSVTAPIQKNPRVRRIATPAELKSYYKKNEPKALSPEIIARETGG